MLNTVGRMMPLNSGAKQIKLSPEDLKEGLREEGLSYKISFRRNS